MIRVLAEVAGHNFSFFVGEPGSVETSSWQVHQGSAVRIFGSVATLLVNERRQQAGDLVESGGCSIHPPAYLGEPAAHLGS